MYVRDVWKDYNVNNIAQLIVPEKQNHKVKKLRAQREDCRTTRRLIRAGSVEKRVLVQGMTKNLAVTLAEPENTARIPPLCGDRLLLRSDALHMTNDGNPTSRLAGVWEVGSLLFATELGNWIESELGLDGMLLQHSCWVCFLNLC